MQDCIVRNLGCFVNKTMKNIEENVILSNFTRAVVYV